jgi:hypothetical protein
VNWPHHQPPLLSRQGALQPPVPAQAHFGDHKACFTQSPVAHLRIIVEYLWGIYFLFVDWKGGCIAGFCKCGDYGRSARYGSIMNESTSRKIVIAHDFSPVLSMTGLHVAELISVRFPDK